MADRSSDPEMNQAVSADTEPGSVREGAGMSRRRMLASSAALGGAAWLLRGIARPGSAYASSPAPAGFPSGPDLYQGIYQNWADEIRTDALWTCAPRTGRSRV